MSLDVRSTLSILRAQVSALCRFFNVSELKLVSSDVQEPLKLVKVDHMKDVVYVSEIYLKNLRDDLVYMYENIRPIVLSRRGIFMPGKLLIELTLEPVEKEQIQNALQVLSVTYRPLGQAVGLHILNRLTSGKLHELAMEIIDILRGQPDDNVVDAAKSIVFLLVELTSLTFSDIMTKMLVYIQECHERPKSYCRDSV